MQRKALGRTCPRESVDMPELKILGICGSLRKASLNMAALRACNELLPAGMTLQITSIAEMPMFNQDVFDAGMPEPVKRLRGEIAAADGLLLASPEYNFSVSGPLKNAIDWGSRPPGPRETLWGRPGQKRMSTGGPPPPPNQVFQDKPVAMFSCTPGPLGGARAQYDLRRILSPLWAPPLPPSGVFIGNAPSKFTDGKLADETTRKFLSELLAGFKDWIVRMQKK